MRGMALLYFVTVLRKVTYMSLETLMGAFFGIRSF